MRQPYTLSDNQLEAEIVTYGARNVGPYGCNWTKEEENRYQELLKEYALRRILNKETIDES